MKEFKGDKIQIDIIPQGFFTTDDDFNEAINILITKNRKEAFEAAREMVEKKTPSGEVYAKVYEYPTVEDYLNNQK